MAGRIRLALAVTCFGFIGAAWAQDGSAVYQENCARCHDAAQGRTPPVSTLRAMSQTAILEVLVNGVMKMQAASLTHAQKRAVATYLGKAPAPEMAAANNVCLVINSGKTARAALGNWSSWGVDLANTRFQTAAAAGLTAAQVPGLKVKWSFYLGPDAEPRSQPAIVNGTLFVGAGKLYALNAQSGCTLWVFGSDAPVRSGLVVGPGAGNDAIVYFGDFHANIYAVSAATGKLVWKTHADDNFAAMVSGTPVVYKGVLYAGISSFEEVMAASPKYPCCSFRGSVVALNAMTGARIWKTYTIAEPPQAIAGTAFQGPSGAGIWSSPTIDEKLQRLYVSTGDNYSAPATATSDAVIAMDLATGKTLWARQATPGDIYNVGCDAGVHGACPETHGHDFDFGQPPILAGLAAGRRALVIGQKSGFVHAFDPDADGRPMWSRRVGEGGTLGGVQWGSAAANGHVYVALSDLRLQAVPDSSEKAGYRLVADGTKGGGLFALNAETGNVVWSAKPVPCGDRRPCSPAQSAAVSGIPGVVFSGSLDGHLRAYAAGTGAVIWDGDTERDYVTVSGEKAHGGSLDVAGPVIAGGAVYVMSGYSRYGGMPGNVLVVYSPGGN